MKFESLSGLIDEVINTDRSISILYAFNGTGKTRLSMELVNKFNTDEEEKVLYFNAFIEDLFQWYNDAAGQTTEDEFLFESSSLKLDINSNFFKILKDSGREAEVINLFQYYTQSSIEPSIDFENGHISFDLVLDDAETTTNIKISRGEESVFMWSIFYVLVEEIIGKYNEVESGDSDELDTSFEYIFIDDPVSSLDDNHLMSVVLDLVKLLKSSDSKDLKFIITTHHPLFYNVLHNSFPNRKRDPYKANKYLFKKVENNYILEEQNSDTPFAYHLEIKRCIADAIEKNDIKKYHFTLFRNLLEKTATFLGYKRWSECIIDDNRDNYARVINLYSHNKHSIEEYKEPTDPEKTMLVRLFNNFLEDFKWYKEE